MGIPLLERRARPDGPEAGAGPQRICFLYNAQLHQVLHSISIAAELAHRPVVSVEVWATNAGHLDYAREAVGRLGGGPIVYRLAGAAVLRGAARVMGRAAPPKRLTLASLAHRLATFDAIVTPERTSIALKALGVTGPAFIHTGHGAGDRAGSLEARLARFDFALVAGLKTRSRLERDGLIRPGANEIIGYPKFEAADAIRDRTWRPFADHRPVVLYNPHFRDDVSSWAQFGPRLLEQFARQSELNLVFAPHIRLFEGRRRQAATRRALAAFSECPNIHIDLGGPRTVDMTYTALADLYVGDVSSQVYEYLRDPRPCLFLNPGVADWALDESYAHWRFGPVAAPDHDLVAAAQEAIRTHPFYLSAQKAGVWQTFDMGEVSASHRAASAIETLVRRRAAEALARRGAAESRVIRHPLPRT
jgi:hypothetical protein